jgi:hypothetical protein
VLRVNVKLRVLLQAHVLVLVLRNQNGTVPVQVVLVLVLPVVVLRDPFTFFMLIKIFYCTSTTRSTSLELRNISTTRLKEFTGTT